ncbi:preprotein translocase subunit YajC [Chloroflexota bacterium]
MEKSKILKLGLTTGLLASVVFIGGCIPTDGEGGTSTWTMLIFVALLFGLMYFVMIRPQMKRQKEHQQLIEELKRGDKVVTAGGIHGVIESISEDSVLIKVESGATMRINKGSVTLKQE